MGFRVLGFRILGVWVSGLVFGGFAGVFGCEGRRDFVCKQRFGYVGSFPLTVTVTRMGNRSSNSPLNKAPFKDSYWEGE